MEDDQGRSSPPLVAKGAYTIDFDALDDSFNPFEAKKAMPNSPPLGRKELTHSPTPEIQSDLVIDTKACGDNANQKDAAEVVKTSADVPKKKRSKSATAKRSSGGVESDKDIDQEKNQFHLQAGDGNNAAPTDVAPTEKPAK